MVNRGNYHLTQAYLSHLRQVKQLNSCSVGRYRFYLRHLLLWADETSFGQIPDIRPTFSDFLIGSDSDRQIDLLAPTTLKKIVQTSKRFLTWAKLNHPRDFRSLSAAWIEDLCPPRQIQPQKEHVFVALEEVLQLATLETETSDLARQRDQAAAALLYVSGMRAGALGSLPLQSIDVQNREVKQWPSLGVKTKRGKSATTYLLEIPELLAVIERWDTFIRAQLPATAMWYTPIIIRWGEHILDPGPAGSNRCVAIGRRIRRLFAVAGLNCKSPHKFRHGHAVYALQRAKTMADYKAVSMNLMHDDIRVTDRIYAPLLGDEVRQRIAGLAGQTAALPLVGSDLDQLLRGLSKGQMSEALHILADEIAR